SDLVLNDPFCCQNLDAFWIALLNPHVGSNSCDGQHGRRAGRQPARNLALHEKNQRRQPDQVGKRYADVPLQSERADHVWLIAPTKRTRRQIPPAFNRLHRANDAVFPGSLARRPGSGAGRLEAVTIAATAVAAGPNLPASNLLPEFT